jgi:hypothetical protein
MFEILRLSLDETEAKHYMYEFYHLEYNAL